MRQFRHMRVWQYVDEVARAGSIRQAAQRLNITPSALQRRIQDVEEDLGAPVFERFPKGVLLTTAGEMLIRWIRSQAADLDRVHQQIEDLRGLRRGHVKIACSQALAHAFLPEEMAKFTTRYPGIQFSVSVIDHAGGLALLRNYEVDLALIFQPKRNRDFQPLISIGQRLVAIMANDHPLAARTSVRLRDCAAYPLALPDKSFSGRRILDEIVVSSSFSFEAQLEVNSFELLRAYVRYNHAITFQIAIGAKLTSIDKTVVVLPIDDRDLAHGSLVLGQLRGRSLPVAVTKFVEQLAQALDQQRTLPTLL